MKQLTNIIMMMIFNNSLSQKMRVLLCQTCSLERSF